LITIDLLLIDGDELLYKACAGHEQEVPWDLDAGIWTTWTETDKAATHVREKVREAVARYEPKHAVFCLSGDHRFREAVVTDYKSARTKVRKPTGYVHVRDEIVEWVEKHYGKDLTLARYDMLEADDCMGILATKPGNEGSVILSQDKDMRQIPGMLAPYIGAEPYLVTDYEANKWFLTQVLTGDAVDGYKGCPGIGPAKAEALLSNVKTRNADVLLREGWRVVRETYLKAGLTEDDAIAQARLARILRWDDWDREKKEPKLWLPPKQ
jgi:DNA polymerase-1